MDKVRGVMKHVADAAAQASGGLSRFALTVASVATKIVGYGILSGLYLLKLAIAAIPVAIDATVGSFFRLYKDLSEFRQQTGMTTDELREFTNSVIEASRRYGVAISSVGDIARTVAIGTNASAKSVAEFAGKMSLLGMVTGQSDRTIAEFAYDTTRALGLSKDQAFQLAGAIAKVTEAAMIPAEAVTGDFIRAKDAIKDLGLEEQKLVYNQIPAFTTAMRMSGAEAHNIDSLLSGMLDTTSDLGKQFASAGYRMQPFLERLHDIGSAPRQDTQAWQAYNKIFQQYGANLAYAYDALKFLPGLQEEFNAALSDPDVGRSLQSRAGLFVRVQQMANKVIGALLSVGEKVFSDDFVVAFESGLAEINKALDKVTSLSDLWDVIATGWTTTGYPLVVEAAEAVKDLLVSAFDFVFGYAEDRANRAIHKIKLDFTDKLGIFAPAFGLTPHHNDDLMNPPVKPVWKTGVPYRTPEESKKHFDETMRKIDEDAKSGRFLHLYEQFEGYGDKKGTGNFNFKGKLKTSALIERPMSTSIGSGTPVGPDSALVAARMIVGAVQEQTEKLKSRPEFAAYEPAHAGYGLSSGSPYAVLGIG